MLDEGMLYWYARLSVAPARPSRSGSATSAPPLDDAILLAALVRGLVATAAARTSTPAGRRPNGRTTLLIAAHWRAAHDGLEGLAIDLATRRAAARRGELMRQLFDYVTPALERHGDLRRPSRSCSAGCARSGTGAARQRARGRHQRRASPRR